MKAKGNKSDQLHKKVGDNQKDNLSGYPLYPSNEDIFSKSKEEKELNPDDISKFKEINDIKGAFNEKDFNDIESGDDLDFPDSELDDVQKNAGIEDEENSYFSLGGDDHNDLDENKGE